MMKVLTQETLVRIINQTFDDAEDRIVLYEALSEHSNYRYDLCEAMFELIAYGFNDVYVTDLSESSGLPLKLLDIDYTQRNLNTDVTLTIGDEYLYSMDDENLKYSIIYNSRDINHANKVQHLCCNLMTDLMDLILEDFIIQNKDDFKVITYMYLVEGKGIVFSNIQKS